MGEQGAFSFGALKQFILGGQTDAPALEADRVPLATCVVLLEVAQADDEFSAEESEHVLEVLRERFALSGEDAEELIRTAQAEREGSVDLWHFTHAINEGCSRDEKLATIEHVWGIIYADGTLTKHEDWIAHKLAKLLNLDHKELIDAKLRVLNAQRGKA